MPDHTALYPAPEALGRGMSLLSFFFFPVSFECHLPMILLGIKHN